MVPLEKLSKLEQGKDLARLAKLYKQGCLL